MGIKNHEMGRSFQIFYESYKRFRFLLIKVTLTKGTLDIFTFFFTLGYSFRPLTCYPD
jgi:hypothetical protein